MANFHGVSWNFRWFLTIFEDSADLSWIPQRPSAESDRFRQFPCRFSKIPQRLPSTWTEISKLDHWNLPSVDQLQTKRSETSAPWLFYNDDHHKKLAINSLNWIANDYGRGNGNCWWMHRVPVKSDEAVNLPDSGSVRITSAVRR